ncbi:hypothetical protein PMAA_040030 [Talaromyces marneffei ATCC 18224]|uniref:Mannan endo-1,6-alpha-mannosidase n=1 Tax=Talaromyces marneffei (strain ATCC 18224 / CBS 334.59 / QM 7333) TaxID=441960 RepID=B6QQ26_TALMQ|nr:hypothetical protein PMAA_040030 [Talaromyces marneffei ATCC 18224]
MFAVMTIPFLLLAATSLVAADDTTYNVNAICTWSVAIQERAPHKMNPDYLNLAISIYNDISGGLDTPCGGLYWSKTETYIASIANELYIALAAGLANRVSSDLAGPYLDAAVTGWDWFVNIGVVGDDWLVVDGVDNNTCQPTGNKYSSTTNSLLCRQFRQKCKLYCGLKVIVKFPIGQRRITRHYSIHRAWR